MPFRSEKIIQNNSEEEKKNKMLKEEKTQLAQHKFLRFNETRKMFTMLGISIQFQIDNDNKKKFKESLGSSQ